MNQLETRAVRRTSWSRANGVLPTGRVGRIETRVGFYWRAFAPHQKGEGGPYQKGVGGPQVRNKHVELMPTPACVGVGLISPSRKESTCPAPHLPAKGGACARSVCLEQVTEPSMHPKQPSKGAAWVS